MKFKTTLNIEPREIQIEHDSEIILMGSCFSEHIGQNLMRYKFRRTCNPFGTIFHPVPIAWLLQSAISKTILEKDDLAYSGSLFYHDQFHYSFSSPDPEEALRKMNFALKEIAEKLACANFLCITFGSAIGYSHRKKNRIVANCHKLDPGAYNKSISNFALLEEKWVELIENLAAINPSIQIIITISPVRHIRDGMVQSSRSKATLNVFVHALIERFQNLHYFPAFELLVDDLRDYRFYTDDLVHPGNMAIRYIWKSFSQAFFSDKTKQINQTIEKILKASSHRIQHASTEENKLFIKKQLRFIEEFQLTHPKIDMEEERDYFKNLI